MARGKQFYKNGYIYAHIHTHTFTDTHAAHTHIAGCLERVAAKRSGLQGKTAFGGKKPEAAVRVRRSLGLEVLEVLLEAA